MLMQSFDSAPARADLAACRAALRVGSKSFSGASRLLPPSVRDAATALYAFCREADDAVDLHAGGAGAVLGLRERLDRVYAARPLETPVDRSLYRVVATYQLPRQLFDALIEGFEWDAQGRRYQTIAELEDYAARVAGTIGAMMALLMGVRDPSAVGRACDLGVAMQLTNIARDVGEDARAGRLYLPLKWMAYAGIDVESWLANPQMSDGLRMVINDLLCEADYLYAGVESGVAQLPRGCQAGINAARFIYADIGRVVRASGCDSLSQRAVVSKSRKAALLFKSFAASARSNRAAPFAQLVATQYLVQSVVKHEPEQGGRTLASPLQIPWWRIKSRALWLIDLFERMERRSLIDERGRSPRGLTVS
jgi:phytoene synthase